jgi:hypothetical protein
MNTLLFDRLGLRAGALCFAFVLAAGALACDGDDGDDVASETMGDGDGDGTEVGDGDGEDETGSDDPISHAVSIQPIWDASCVSCHVAGGAGAVLDLTNGFPTLVGVDSVQAPALKLVLAGNSADSYLVHKLRNTHIDAGGSGGVMPLGAAALPEATIVLIEDWINMGARP